MGSNGWLCKAGSHTTDPITGLNYHTEIANTISQYGFVPLTLGATGGGTTTTNYCRLFQAAADHR